LSDSPEAKIDEGARIYPPRTGSCEIDERDAEFRAVSKKESRLVDKADELDSTSRINNRIDTEAVELAQEALRDSIKNRESTEQQIGSCWSQLWRRRSIFRHQESAVGTD
jgi:hypothetical protein